MNDAIKNNNSDKKKVRIFTEEESFIVIGLIMVQLNMDVGAVNFGRPWLIVEEVRSGNQWFLTPIFT